MCDYPSPASTRSQAYKDERPRQTLYHRFNLEQELKYRLNTARENSDKLQSLEELSLLLNNNPVIKRILELAKETGLI